MQTTTGPLNEPSDMTHRHELHRSATCPVDGEAEETAANPSRPRPSRRSSLITGAGPSRMRAPRRSSLLTSAYSPPAADSPAQPRRRPQRRSSVTFTATMVTETKEVPKVECPLQRDAMFYTDAEYTQFRWDRMQERNVQIKAERERKVREEQVKQMQRWRENLMNGRPEEHVVGVNDIDRGMAQMTFQQQRGPGGGIPQQQAPSSSDAFTSKFRRASPAPGCGGIVGGSNSVSLPTPFRPKPAGSRASMA